MNNFCGLDFGTSNSSIGFWQNGELKLTKFGDKTYTPSSIFFEFDEDEPCFGDMAINRYIDGKEGRMIWSPKNALGTSLIHEKTQIKDQSMTFTEIIGFIIKNLKFQCEAQSDQELTNIVVGRPVYYNDKDQKLDQGAQDAMFGLLKDLGFQNIEFEFEPIAAAAYYEQSVNREEIALIVDMGGGTSDFTVAKLDKNSVDQKDKILSIGGIHIAGTNFDRRLSLAKLMPELGLGCSYKTFEGNWASIPPTLHKDLATWHKIGLCYTKPNINYVKAKSYSADEPHKFERLGQILNQRLGHHAAMAVEKGKIALTKSDLVDIKINDVTPHIDVSLTKEDLDNSIREDVEKIVTTLKDTLRTAQISATDVSAIFMTGGASLVPLVRSKILSLLPEARLIDGDKFGSVATGLTLLSAQRFC